MPTIRRREYIIGNFTQHSIEPPLPFKYGELERYAKEICHRRAILFADYGGSILLKWGVIIETLDCCKTGKCSTWRPDSGVEPVLDWTLLPRDLLKTIERFIELLRNGKSVPGMDYRETLIEEVEEPKVEEPKQVDTQEFELGLWTEKFRNPSSVFGRLVHRKVFLVVRGNQYKLLAKAMDCCVQRLCTTAPRFGDGYFDHPIEKVIKDTSVLPLKIIAKANKIMEGIKKQNDSRREPIPDDVRMYVWQRDGGKCVVCGSQERLEYDHIIPISQGGSNTARNIQLLCETCNRSKGGSII